MHVASFAHYFLRSGKGQILFFLCSFNCERLILSGYAPPVFKSILEYGNFVILFPQLLTIFFPKGQTYYMETHSMRTFQKQNIGT